MKLRLWSNEQRAAQATDRTLRMLPQFIGGSLLGDKDGEIVFDEQGFATAIPSGNPNMFADAIVRQGYVKEVVK